MNNVASGLYILDAKGYVAYVNPAAETMFGWTNGELLGRKMHDVTHYKHPDGTPFPAADCPHLQIVQGGIELREQQDVFVRKDGSFFPVVFSASPLKKGGKTVGIVVGFRDDTLRREADRRLRESEESLSKVSQRLIEAQEKERSWIARELHDDINQRLSMLAMHLGMLAQAPLSINELRQKIQEANEQVAELSSDIQVLSHRLHSSNLKYLGLVDAACALCREFSARPDMAIDFHSEDVPNDLPQDVSLCLFRVLQEALQNAAKHSRATDVHVSLSGKPSGIQLTVRDSGIGFDPEKALKGTGLGLTSMRERLKLVNGDVSIDSQSGRGTTIHAHVPLRIRG